MFSDNFRPFSFITGSHTQTLIGTMFTFSFEPESETKYVELPDGDKLALEVTTPKDWTPEMPTVCMLHGLCGSHKSTYLVRMSRKLTKFGIRCVRMNMRGCGSGRGLAKNIYHSGSSEDMHYALQALKIEQPLSDIILIGFSLGGNVVLKLAAELSRLGKDSLVKHVISVSPPINLASSVQLLDDEVNKIYSRYFMHHLLSDVEYRHKIYPELPKPSFPYPMTFDLFEKLYICPTFGFTSSEDYHEKCSSGPMVPSITLPCHILFAKDDPIIDCSSLLTMDLPSNITLRMTEHGGHMGFIGSPLDVGGFYWMDTQLLRWISESTKMKLI